MHTGTQARSWSQQEQRKHCSGHSQELLRKLYIHEWYDLDDPIDVVALAHYSLNDMLSVHHAAPFESVPSLLADERAEHRLTKGEQPLTGELANSIDLRRNRQQISQ